MFSINDMVKIVSDLVREDIREFCEENRIEDWKDYFRSIGSGSCWKGYFKSFGYDNMLFKETIFDHLEEKIPGNAFVTDDLEFIPISGNPIPYREWIQLVRKEVFA